MNRISLSTIKTGDVFFEHDMGSVCKMTALEDAHRTTETAGWTCQVTAHYHDGDKEIKLFQSDECPAYLGLKLYRS